MAKEFDKDGFDHPTVRHITDMVHDLLNGADDGIIRGDRTADTMRVSFDVPKAWLLFAAWFEATRRDPATGKLNHWPVERFDLTDDAVWDEIRAQAEPLLFLLMNNEMHALLHDICHGNHGMFWIGEDDPPPRPSGDDLPF